MAIVWVNVSAQGGRHLSGTQLYEVKRGAAQSGDVSVAIDTTKVTTKSQLRDAAAAAIASLLDTLT